MFKTQEGFLVTIDVIDILQGFNFRAALQARENQHLGRGYSCLNCNRLFYVEKDLVKHQEGCLKLKKGF